MESKKIIFLICYLFLLVAYYKLLLPFYFGETLNDPEITVLAQQRSLKPLGGVLRRPSGQRQKARLYGELEPKLGNYCFMLVLWSDDYVLPAAVLIRSLLLYGTSHEIHVLVPNSGPDMVSQRGIDALEMLGARITRVPSVYNMLNLPEPSFNGGSGGTDDDHPKNYISPMFLKLQAWNFQGTYDRVLLLDADSLVITNIDTLLFAPACLKVDLCTAYTTTSTSAPTSKLAQKIGILNYFNAGFLHIKPSLEKFNIMVERAKKTQFVSVWAYEQDFLNLMVHEKILNSTQIRPVGHFNKFPATKLIHYTSGKPWGWRSYPVHIPWTPKRKFWGIVQSWSWMSTRYTLPGSFSLLTFSSISMLLLPIIVTVSMSKNKFIYQQNQLYKKIQSSNLIDTCVPVLVLWTITIGAPRLKYDPGWLLPARMPPTTAWIVLSLNTSAVVFCTFPGLLHLFSGIRIACTILCTVCFVTVLEVSHIKTSYWGIGMIFLSGMYISCLEVKREERVRSRRRRSRLD